MPYSSCHGRPPARTQASPRLRRRASHPPPRPGKPRAARSRGPNGSIWRRSDRPDGAGGGRPHPPGSHSSRAECRSVDARKWIHANDPGHPNGEGKRVSSPSPEPRFRELSYGHQVRHLAVCATFAALLKGSGAFLKGALNHRTTAECVAELVGTLDSFAGFFCLFLVAHASWYAIWGRQFNPAIAKERSVTHRDPLHAMDREDGRAEQRIGPCSSPTLLLESGASPVERQALSQQSDKLRSYPKAPIHPERAQASRRTRPRARRARREPRLIRSLQPRVILSEPRRVEGPLPAVVALKGSLTALASSARYGRRTKAQGLRPCERNAVQTEPDTGDGTHRTKQKIGS